MRLLTYTNLYPSSDLPRHGVFVEERLRHLVATGSVTADVIALRPKNTMSPRVYAGIADDMPNVMLESLACGTRVVATKIGGIGEVVTALAAGAIMASRSANAVVESVRALLESRHERHETRSFAERFGWDDTVQRQLSLYERVVSR